MEIKSDTLIDIKHFNQYSAHQGLYFVLRFSNKSNNNMLIGKPVFSTESIILVKIITFVMEGIVYIMEIRISFLQALTFSISPNNNSLYITIVYHYIMHGEIFT